MLGLFEIGDEVFEFRCSSIHDEKLEVNGSITERRHFGFSSETGIHMSLSWEDKHKRTNQHEE